jgi:5-methylcytosine-specific restriction endonuclease McrA
MICQSKMKGRLKDQLFAGRIQAPCCFCERLLFPRQATIEHIRPLSQGGGWELANLAISCDACNHTRGARDFDAFKHETQQVVVAVRARAQELGR